MRDKNEHLQRRFWPRPPSARPTPSLYCRFLVPFLKNLQCKIFFAEQILAFFGKVRSADFHFLQCKFLLGFALQILFLAVQILCLCGGRVRPRQTDTQDPWRRQDTNTTETRPENSSGDLRQVGFHGKFKNRSFPRPPSTRPPYPKP